MERKGLRKGISPLIAAVLLIAFTMAVGSIFAQWAPNLLQGIQEGTTEDANRISSCTDARLSVRANLEYNPRLDNQSVKIDAGNKIGSGDFDGDGSTAEIAFNPGYDSSRRIHVYDVRSGNIIQMKNNSDLYNYVISNQAGDTDGDGLNDDIGYYHTTSSPNMRIYDGSSESSSAASDTSIYWHMGGAGDVDEDGKKDHIAYEAGGSRVIGVYDAEDEVEDRTIYPTRALGGPADLNNDGSEDEIIFWHNQLDTVQILDYNPNETTNTTINLNSNPGTMAVVGDMNRNGVRDVVYPKDGNWWFYDPIMEESWNLGIEANGRSTGSLDVNGNDIANGFAFNLAGYIHTVNTGSLNTTVTIVNEGSEPLEEFQINAWDKNQPLKSRTIAENLSSAELTTVDLDVNPRPTKVEVSSTNCPTSDTANVDTNR